MAFSSLAALHALPRSPDAADRWPHGQLSPRVGLSFGRRRLFDAARASFKRRRQRESRHRRASFRDSGGSHAA